MRMHKRRTMPAAQCAAAARRRVRPHRIGAVHFLKMKVGKPETNREMLPPAVCTSTGTESRTRYLARKKSPAASVRRRVQPSKTRLRWSYRRERYIRDFIAVEFDILKLPIIDLR